MGVRAEEPEMKVLLALTFLLAALVLALSQPDIDRDVELLRDQLGVREKRESAGGNRKGAKKEKKKKKRKNARKRKQNKKTSKKGVGQKYRNKRKRKQQKKKYQKKNNNKRKGKKFKKKKNIGKMKEGRNTTTCSDSTKVSSDCLENAVYVLKYLRSQVRTFNRKFARIKSF